MSETRTRQPWMGGCLEDTTHPLYEYLGFFGPERWWRAAANHLWKTVQGDVSKLQVLAKYNSATLVYEVEYCVELELVTIVLIHTHRFRAQPMSTIYDDIKLEREAQDAKWGGPSHDDEHSVSDFVGFIRDHARRATMQVPSSDGRAYQRKQMIRVAALAVACIEAIERAEGLDALQPTLEKQCEDWNTKHPRQTNVRFWPGAREGDGQLGVTSSEALILGGYMSGVHIRGAGFVALTHVEAIDDEGQRNGVTCRLCGDTIVSMHRHDLVACKCGAVSIDGGQHYTRIGGKPENYLETIIETIELRSPSPVVPEHQEPTEPTES